MQQEYEEEKKSKESLIGKLKRSDICCRYTNDPFNNIV